MSNIALVRLEIRYWLSTGLLFLFFAQLIMGARPLEETVEQEYPLEPASTLSITNTDGTIRIYACETSKVLLHAIKKAYTADRLKEIAINVKATPNHIAIENVIPPKKSIWSDRSGTVDYVLTIPETTKISKLDLTNGEVLIESVHGGSVAAHLVNGWMCAHNCFGDLNLTIVNGRMDIVFDWWTAGLFSAKASSTNGSVRAILPSDASISVSAQTKTGWVSSAFEMPDESDTHELVRVLNFSLGSTPRVPFKLEAGDGNIRIEKSY